MIWSEQFVDDQGALLAERLERFLFAVDVRELLEAGFTGQRFAQAVDSARQTARLSTGEARVIVMDVKRASPPTEARGLPRRHL